MVQNPFEVLENRLQRIEEILLQQTTEKTQQATTAENPILSRLAAAQFLGLSLPTLHKLTQQGRIKGRRIGSRVRYYQKDLEKALSEIKPFRMP